MKEQFKKWKNFLVLLIVVCISGLTLRLIELSLWPVFADEAIYIRWSQIMAAEPTLRFLPLSDGKQPLFMWMLMTYVNSFSDPLVAGRLLSVVAGLFTIIGIFVLTFLLFKNKRAGLVASTLWALSPYPAFFERLALVDALLTMFFVGTAIFAVLTVRTKRIDAAMAIGFFLGGAVLTKSSGIFAFLLLPASLILAKIPNRRSQIYRLMLQFGSLFLLSSILAFFMYNIQRLGPNFHMLTSRTQDYIFPLDHILTSPLDPFIPYFNRAWQWISIMGPSILPILFLVGLLTGFSKKRRETLFLLIWFLVPLLVQAEYAKVFTARYILFLLPPLYVISSQVMMLEHRLARRFVYVALSIFFIQSILFNQKLLTDPAATPIPKGERAGFLEEWTSGTGIKEIANYLKKVRRDHPDVPIVVGTEGSFGTLPDGLQMYFQGFDNVNVFGVGLNIEEVPSSLIESAEAGNLTYFVANDSRFNFDTDQQNLEVVATYEKANRRTDAHEYSLYGPQDTLFLIKVLP